MNDLDQLFGKYAGILSGISDAGLRAEIATPSALSISSSSTQSCRLEAAFAPFDHVNGKADIVIVGLTPGRQQMQNALLEAVRVLRRGGTNEQAMAAAKVHASFSGPMRANLVAMLDHVGVNEVLGIATAASLWLADEHRVHFTSALRYPVFKDGDNYSGNPPVSRTPFLNELFERFFIPEMQALPDAIYVPLGPQVTDLVESAANECGIDPARVLSGLPHPSAANAERIAYFLGRKDRADLSMKTSAGKIDAARASVLKKIGILSVPGIAAA